MIKKYKLGLTADELRETVGWLKNGNHTSNELAGRIEERMRDWGINPRCAVIGCSNEATRVWGGRPHCEGCMPPTLQHDELEDRYGPAMRAGAEG